MVRRLPLSACLSVVGYNCDNCENHVRVGQQEVSTRIARSLTSIGPGLFLLNRRHAYERVRLLPFDSANLLFRQGLEGRGLTVVSELDVGDREISSAVTWGWAAVMCHQAYPVQRCERKFQLTNVVQHWTEKDIGEGVRAVGLRATMILLFSA